MLINDINVTFLGEITHPPHLETYQPDEEKEDAVRGRLNSSNHKHLVYIKQGETIILFP